MTLTTDVIREAEPKLHEYALRDGEGLALRVLPSGTKVWSVYYWERGRKRNKSPGRWPDMGIRAARAERDRIKALAAGANAITLEAFAEEYITSWAQPNKDSWREDRRMIDKDIIPELGDRPIVQITRRDCTRVVDRVQKRGAPDMTARTHACLRRLLQYAVDRGIRDDNPASRMGVRQSDARDRVLGSEELVAWWRSLQAEEIPPGPRIALSLVLATGQRPGEVLTMEPKDIDRIDQLWNIPREKAKNNHAHVVPLTDWAQALIDEARGLWPTARYVIPIAASTMRDWMRASVKAAEIDRATPHDLRRTVATWLGRLGYTGTVQDKVLNHVDQSVGGIYDRYEYLTEKREALEAWRARFREITQRGDTDE